MSPQGVVVSVAGLRLTPYEYGERDTDGRRQITLRVGLQGSDIARMREILAKGGVVDVVREG